MGKTKGKAPTKPAAVPAQIVPTSGSSGTSTSSSASANSYQNLIRALFSTPEDAGDERTEILRKLAIEYKQLVISNKLNALKDGYLTAELQEIQEKYNDASEDHSKSKEEHDALNTKYLKLKQLSQQLSDRTKQSDAKAAAVLYEEQQKRVKLTESFSASIASISSKLDSLTTRREIVVTENIRLKAILKSYLEEFDADQRAQQEQDGVPGAATAEGEAAAGDAEEDPTLPALDPPVVAPVEENAVESADKPVELVDAKQVNAEGEAGATAAEEGAVPPPEAGAAATAEQEEAAQRERASEAANQELMAAAEDVTRLQQLRAEERELRLKSAAYSELFDSFQTKLAGCNTGFQEKQSSIEALSKEMIALEKENAAISKRVADCVMSTKVMMNMHSNTLVETQKQVKVMERYSALIDLMQKEIDAAAAATTIPAK